MSTPRSFQGSCAGSLTWRTLISRPSTMIASSVCVTVPGIRAVGRVVLEEQRVRRDVDDVVDGHDLDVRGALDDRLERLAADAAEAVDADANGHGANLRCAVGLVRWRRPPRGRPRSVGRRGVPRTGGAATRNRAGVAGTGIPSGGPDGARPAGRRGQGRIGTLGTRDLVVAAGTAAILARRRRAGPAGRAARGRGPNVPPAAWPENRRAPARSPAGARVCVEGWRSAADLEDLRAAHRATPDSAGLPFFIVICCGSLTSRFALHLTQ